LLLLLLLLLLLRARPSQASKDVWKGSLGRSR
jgi:hypothetical protein